LTNCELREKYLASKGDMSKKSKRQEADGDIDDEDA
jgi:hypothetical protein